MPLKSGGAVESEFMRGRSNQGLMSIGKGIFIPIVNIITTEAYYTNLPWQKNVVRTSDGTIHVLMRSASAITHFYSRDDGKTWTKGDDLWAVLGSCSIDADTNDNLIAVRGDGADGIHFKKATVTKNATWTWSWGSDVEINSGPTLFYPDIIADGNNYYHIVYYDTSPLGVVEWERSIDGGATWTRIDLTAFSLATEAGIIKDKNNNLYVFGSHGSPDYVRALKITYSAGPSWSIGTCYNVSHITTAGWCSIQILANGKLILIYIEDATGNLFFRKSTNAYDVSAWDTQVQITTISPGDISDQYGSIMVLSNTKIRVYHCKDFLLSYQESTDGGVTFGTEQSVWATGTNSRVNVSKKAVGSKIDYVWLNDLPARYHSYMRP